MKTRIRYLLLLLTFSSYIGATDYTITVASNMCDDTKEYTIAENNSIVLHAHPDAGYVFTKWSDGNTDNPRIVKVTENAIYKAEYTAMSPMPTTHTITVCAEDCENPTVKEMVEGEVLTIYPYPSPGYAFSKWSDGNTDNPRVVTITSDATYEAQFIASSEPNPDGMYTFAVKAEDCSNSLLQNFAQGTEVKLYAHPEDECSVFTKWSDGNTDNPRTITVNSDATYTAIFKAEQYTIYVESADESQGTVSVEKIDN